MKFLVNLFELIVSAWNSEEITEKTKYQKPLYIKKFPKNRKRLIELNEVVKAGTFGWRPLFSLQAWIGLYEDVNSWRWSLSDEAFYQDYGTLYRNWPTGQPDNNGGSGESCLEMTGSGEWNDIGCDQLRKPICSSVSGEAFISLIHFYISPSSLALLKKYSREIWRLTIWIYYNFCHCQVVWMFVEDPNGETEAEVVSCRFKDELHGNRSINPGWTVRELRNQKKETLWRNLQRIQQQRTAEEE